MEEMKFGRLDQVIVEGYHAIFTVVGVHSDEKKYTLISGIDRINYCLPEKSIRMYRKHTSVDIRTLSKMYVIVRNEAPIGLGINSVGHAVSAAMKTFNKFKLEEWSEQSNRQVTCIATDEEIYNCLEEADKVGLTTAQENLHKVD